MYFRTPRRTRATAHTNEFIQAALGQLRTAGRNHVPLGDVVVTHKGQRYTAADVAASHPFLSVNSSALVLDGDRYRHRDEHDMAAIVLGYRESVVRDLGKQLRAGRFRPRQPVRMEVPKVGFGHDISIEALRAGWSQDGGAVRKGTRPLVIDDPRLRIVSSSVAMVIGAYLAWRWPNCVVGCRAGVSIPRVLASVDAAARTTGWTTVVAADVRGFFDRVRYAWCRKQLRDQLGLPDQHPLESLLDLCLQFRPQEGLPQGNSLSPLLANLYGTNALDRVARQHGPYLRFVDDLLLLVPSQAAADRAVQEIQASATLHGLELHPTKSVVHDLATGLQRPALGGGSEQRPLVYLGLEIRQQGQALTYHLTNQAVSRLHESLREVWWGRAHRDEHPRDHFLRRLMLARFSFLGWQEAFGFASWTGEQDAAVGAIQALAFMTDSSLGTAAADQAPQIHQEAADQAALMSAIARVCRMREYRQVDGADGLRVFNRTLDEMRDRGRERFQQACLKPIDLPWGHATQGHWHHTAQKSSIELGSVVSDPFAIVPAPTGELVYRPGREHAAGDPTYAAPPDVVDITAELA